MTSIIRLTLGRFSHGILRNNGYQGKRVHLALLEDKHISHYLQLSDDPELVAAEGWRPFGTDEKERFLQTLHILTLPYCNSGETLAFSIISDADNKTIGYASGKGITEARPAAEVGIAIMEKEYRGQGYGTEALSKGGG